jgi:hypothetical protein
VNRSNRLGTLVCPDAACDEPSGIVEIFVIDVTCRRGTSHPSPCFQVSCNGKGATILVEVVSDMLF